jgi:hypothetical protein
MSKHRNPRQRLSKRPTHNNRGGKETPSNYYRQMLHVRGDEDHPIDLVVERRLDRLAPKKLARREREVMSSIDKALVLELEALRSDIRNDREEAFFNVGYEHGVADGLARARRGSIRLSKEVQQFVTETRERMVQLEAPEQAALGLLECLWTLAQREAGAFRTRIGGDA